jgi:hypothetical protein
LLQGQEPGRLLGEARLQLGVGFFLLGPGGEDVGWIGGGVGGREVVYAEGEGGGAEDGEG